jgi:hypothetical protein
MYDAKANAATRTSPTGWAQDEHTGAALAEELIKMVAQYGTTSAMQVATGCVVLEARP